MAAVVNPGPAPMEVTPAAVLEDLPAAEMAAPGGGGGCRGGRLGVGVVGSPPLPGRLELAREPGDGTLVATVRARGFVPAPWAASFCPPHP